MADPGTAIAGAGGSALARVVVVNVVRKFARRWSDAWFVKHFPPHERLRINLRSDRQEVVKSVAGMVTGTLELHNSADFAIEVRALEGYLSVAGKGSVPLRFFAVGEVSGRSRVDLDYEEMAPYLLAAQCTDPASRYQTLSAAFRVTRVLLGEPYSAHGLELPNLPVDPRSPKLFIDG